MKGALRVLLVECVATLATLACGSPAPGAGEGPRECVATFGRDRCDALAVAAADSRGIDPTLVTRVDILPDATTPGGGVAPQRVVDVRLTLRDGGTADGQVHCAGVSPASVPACMDVPAVRLDVPTDEGGYRDIPEGASPVPTQEPGAVADATPLTIASRSIPIAAAGEQRVVLGRAELANGIIQEASFALADPWPDNVVLREAVRLEISPVAGGAPIWNIYEHGWHEGVEQVEVAIVLDAAIVRAGASLELVDVVVR